MSGGGGGGGGPTQSTVTQTNLPEYAKPYYENILQRAMFESGRPYTPYTGQRIAQFSPEETYVQRNIMGLQRPEQIGVASDIARQVGTANMPSGMDIARSFRPKQISPEYRATDFTTGYQAGQFAPGFQAREYQSGYQPGTVTSGYAAGEFKPDIGVERFTDRYQAGTITPGYEAGTFTPGYQAGELRAGFEAGSMATPGTIASYMSPYQQAVTDIEKREAIRAAEQQRPQIGAQAARAGALGGTRAALLEAERQRNLGQQLSDIQARGGQAAFQQAREGFEADRAARLQQAQFGLGAFQAQEAARQRAGEMGFQAQQAGESARQEAARLGLSAQQQNEAARQAQAEFGLKAYQATQGERQFVANINLQAQQAGEQARQRAAEMGMDAQKQNEAAKQAAEQFRQRGFEMGGQERQFAANINLQAQQAGEQARQEAARMGLTAQQQTDAARRAEQEFRTQSQQFNIEQQRQRALLGLEGLASDRAGQAQRLAAAELLGGLGSRQQDLDLQRLGAMGGVGSERRALMQRGLDVGYEDFLRQQAYGGERLGYLSNILQGVPIQPGSTQTTFGRTPSAEQQLLGSGLGALGLYQTLGRPRGGGG